MNFTFRTVPSVIFETGSSARLGALVKSRMTRPVIVTDKGIISAGLIEAALASLKAEGLDYLLFDGIEADPPARVVRASVEIARAAQGRRRHRLWRRIVDGYGED